MKLKKTEKLVVSKKMFVSMKSLNKKDSDEKNSEKSKKKKAANITNVNSKKTSTPKKKKNTSSSQPKTTCAEKDSIKSPTKAKASKGTEKNLGSRSPSKTPAGVTSGKNKDIDWSELGVQRCSGCNFTTNEEGIFAAHLSLCRLFNKQKIKSPFSSPSKKKQANKSDSLVKFAEKPASQFGRLVGIPEKRAVIQEPYLEGSTPAQTVFLFRCYHCRSYFINIQTLKDHHRLVHGTKNLTVSLVPFTDDEAPDDINKKIIVDGSRIVPQVNWRRENTTVIPENIALALQYNENSSTGAKNAMYSRIRLQSSGSTIPTSSTVVMPQTPPKQVPSETVTKDVIVTKNPLQEVCFQVTSSSDKATKSDEKSPQKGAEDIQKSPVEQSCQSYPKLVPTSVSSLSTTNQSTNKMVMLNLIPKNQSVPCSPVQIEIPTNSPLNTVKYLKQIPNLAKVATQAIQTSQESCKNWNNSTRNKAILPKNILLGVRPPPVIDLPIVLPQTSKISPNPGVAIISTAQKINPTTDSHLTNTPGVTSTVASTKQKNRKIILFPLTSNANSSGTVLAPGPPLTATPIAAAITTSAVVTCATTTSTSLATPLPSSLAGPNLQTSVSPLLISSAPAIVAPTVTPVVPSVWLLPSQTSLTSVDSKLTSSQVQNSISKQTDILPKTIHIKSTMAPTRTMTLSSLTSLPMTTQTVTTVMASSPSTGGNTTSPNCSIQNQVVTITPVSEAAPTAAGTSLLEKISVVRPNSGTPKKMKEKSDPSTSDSISLKQDKSVEVSSKCQLKKNETSPHSSPDEQTLSKSTQCVLSLNTKRKFVPDSDTPSSIISSSSKKKAHISSQTSVSKSSTQKNLENVSSSSSSSSLLSTSSSKGVDTSEDFTVALVAKKKVSVSTACTSTVKNTLSTSAAPNVSPLVIVRKSVGSNKLVVHTMVSANKLLQIQDADVLTCSLCAATVNVDLIRSHLYWHFHVENRNSAQCSKDSRCHYCSVIDYVISMIPKNKQPEKSEDTSSPTSCKPLGAEQQSKSDAIVSQDGCLPMECSSDSVDTEPLELKISSTFSLQSDVKDLNNKEGQSVELPDLEPRKEKEMGSQEESPPLSSDLPKPTLSNDEESSGIFTEDCNAASPVLDVEKIDETESHEMVETVDDAGEKSAEEHDTGGKNAKVDDTNKKDKVKEDANKKDKAEDDANKKDKTEDVANKKDKAEDVANKKDKAEDVANKKDKAEDVANKKDKAEDVANKKDKAEDVTNKKDKAEDVTNKKNKAEGDASKNDKVEDVADKNDKVEDVTVKNDKAEDVTNKKDKVEGDANKKVIAEDNVNKKVTADEASKKDMADDNGSEKNMEDDIASEKSALVSSKNFKPEITSQAEKNTLYKGNFYICGFKECPFSSLGMEDFKAHQETKHAKADGYSCVHCQLECLEPEMLVHHMDTHLCGDMFILYRCAFPECNFGTNLMKSFIGHNIQEHPRETVFLCYYCNANFQGCSALHEHLRSNLLKYVHCPHCSVRNSLRDTILSHIKSDHPDKPRRIFVTGQMVCQQKQKVLNGSIFIDSESDSSDIDSDCMIVDDDILDRHLIKHANLAVRDIFGKSVEKEAQSGKSCIQARTNSTHKKSISDDDSDCMIVEDLYVGQNPDGLGVPGKTDSKEVTPKKMCKSSPNDSTKTSSKIQDDTDSEAKLTTNFTKPDSLKEKESVIPNETSDIPVTPLNSSDLSKEKNNSKNLTKLASTNNEKDGSESEENSVYLRVKKVTHTYSRQKENRLGSNQQKPEDKEIDNQKFDKDKTSDSDEKSDQDASTLTKFCKWRILIRNKSPGKVDVGTVGLDFIVNPLYVFVGNELHCRICTFKCVPLKKMHTHILLMHLHVFLYQCNFCHKKCSCKIEMTEHCEQHEVNNQGFTVLPEPNWDQVIRSCLPATCKTSNPNPAVTKIETTQALPFSNKTKLNKTEYSLSSKTVSIGCKRKSLEIVGSVGCKVPSTKENSANQSSSNARISNHEDRNIFSLFSFGLELESEMKHNEEESNLDSCNSLKHGKFDSSFSNTLFTLPNLSSFDKTPVKDLPAQELPERTPTPEGHDQITVDKEQYMRELHLIAISKVSNCKNQKKSLSPVCMSSPDHISKYTNNALARHRSCRTTPEKSPFSLASKSSRVKKSKKSLSRHNMVITPKTLRKKVLSKTSKLKLGRVQKNRSCSKGHLLRSTSKLRQSPRSLKSRTETRKSLLKTPEKYVAQKRSQTLKSPSSLHTKSPQSKSPKPKVSKRLAVNRKRIKATSRKLVKASVGAVVKKQKLTSVRAVVKKQKLTSVRAVVKKQKLTSVRAVVKKQNLTISHGQRSVKKALNQASRKSSVQAKNRILNKKAMISKSRPRLKISSSLKIKAKKHMSVSTGSKSCLFFSCSWCQFRVSDREHFQRHISLHNFFPQGCKMHCPHCSYTTPSALVLEKHIPTHMDKHPFGCRHCGFSAKTKMMVIRHCKRSHPDIPLKLVNRSTCSQKLKPSWPLVSFSPKVRLKKCAFKAGRYACLKLESKHKNCETQN